MVRALLYLRLKSLQNRLTARIKRLRQPKYLFGAIAGAFYFWMIFFRPYAHGGRRAASHLVLGPAGEILPETFPWQPLFLGLGTLLLLLFVVLTWVLPTSRPGLGFTEAEIAFLFPAPISRRMLINFKLLGSQFAILFTSLFFALISNRWSALGGSSVTHALGWWVILSALNLHSTAAALTLTRLMDDGFSTRRRRFIVFGGLAVATVATLAWVWNDLRSPTSEEVAGADPLARYFLTILNGGALGWVLWPFRLILAPFFAIETKAFLLALGPALLVIAAHYLWVLRLEEVSFEEGSLAAAEKRATIVAQARAGTYRFGGTKAKARRDPFHLASVGWPEFAFLWKNLLSTRSYLNLRTFAVLVVLIVGGSLASQTGSDISQAMMTVLAIVSLVMGVYILLFGPHLARQDLRTDLSRADLLKTYPIPSWRLVLGELLTPIAILTALIWLVLLMGVLNLGALGRLPSFPVGLRITGAVCLGVIAPLLVTLQLIVLNAATVIFPGWFLSTRTQAGGIEVMGQRLIFLFGNLIVILVALLPAAGFGALLVFIAQWLIGGMAAVVCATLAVLAVLLGEVWCGLWWLGRRFEKFDLSTELRP